MKVLIYFESADSIKNSGIGRAMTHQLKALELNNVETTIDKNDSYDIAHINTYWPKSQALIKKCKKRGIPVIVHGHSTFEDFRNSFRMWQAAAPFYNMCLKSMYSRADLIIAPTSYAAHLISSYKFVHCNATYISNGISMDDYAPDPSAVKLFRDRFGIIEGEPFIMGVGFPFERKGIHDFFEVARKMPNVKFIWFGALQKILTNQKVLNWIKEKPANVLMPGYVKGDVIHGAYQSAAALFMPSYEETEGIVNLEALASNCPLVCRDIGVYKGWLKDGYNAHLCRNNKEFKAVLESLVKNGEKKEILRNGYDTASKRDLQIIGAKLKETYQSLLDGMLKK